MQITIKNILSSTGVSYWTFMWYRREGLLPGPIRHEKFKGKGSVSYYPVWIVNRIREIEEMRNEGFTLAQVKNRIKWRVSEKLAAITQTSFQAKNGEEVTPSHPLSPAEVLKQIAKQAAAGYLGCFVDHYRVRVRREGRQLTFTITMKISEPDIQELDSARRPSKRKEDEHAN